MKKINEKTNVKLEIESDNMAEIIRLLQLSGLSAPVTSTVDYAACNSCGDVHTGSCVNEKINPVNLNYEDWVIQMTNNGAKTFKSVDPKNPNAGVTAYGCNGEEIGHFSSEVAETRGDETQFDWGHREYSSNGFTGNASPAATDFYGRGDLKVRMHGRGDNSMYNVLVKEWQEFLQEYAEDGGTTAVISTLRGTTPAHIELLNDFLKSSDLGKLVAYPKDPTRVVFVPKKQVGSDQIEQVVTHMFDKVEQHFRMQPFVTQTWKIGGPVSMLETICEEESTLDKVTKEWRNFLNESNQVMSKDQLLNYVRNNIDQDLTVQEDTVGNAFDIIGVKKNGVLILFDGHDLFDITVPDDNYQVNMETGAIDFSEHSYLFEKNQTVGMDVL
jgi:hypothetical protein